MQASGGPRPAPGTLNQMFFGACEEYNQPNAFQFKRGGQYHPISHRTLLERVRHVALGLRAIGVKPGDRVAIVSENRPEWAIVDYGCLTGCLVDVPVYPTLPAEQIAYLLKDSECVAVFVSNAEQAAKLAEIRPEAECVRHVIGFADAPLQGADMTLAELEARGREGETPETIAEWKADALRVKPDDLATLIYTSGTTGKPKGVMLTHDNFHSNVVSSRKSVPISNSDTALSFLPLSHVFERMGDYMFFSVGVSIAYAESVDTVPANLQEVRPSMMMSVPRLYEKMYARVLENAMAGGAVKQRIFFWARKVAEQWADEKLAGREPAGALALKYRIAMKLVFSKLQERTGGKMRYFVSGGAPLAPEINKFFYAAGLTILEGYGLTETSPVIAVNTPVHFRIGTVGRLIEGVEVKIAPDGEILTRGPHVMQGYFKRPDATAEAIDREGWFHTGDIGALTDGYLAITDRKKDLIVTAGGKNIAPQPIENMIKTVKYVSQVVMIGDKRPYPIILVVPNFQQLEPWAKANGLTWSSRSQLIAMPQVNALYLQAINERLTKLARYETPKKVALVEHEFTVENGDLTPSLKIKRRVVEERQRATIEGLYTNGTPDE